LLIPWRLLSGTLLIPWRYHVRYLVTVTEADVG
jgi:hypothetical protein